MTDNTPGQVPEALDDLYLKLHGLSKHLESSGRIDESDAPEAYPAILDAMNLVRRLQSEAAQVPATTAQPVQDYAELLESDEHIGTEERNEIAAELRRLHAQVAALTAAQPAAPQGVAYAELPKLFREALAWGMTYGPAIPAHQWDEMRESMVKQYTERASNGQAPAAGAVAGPRSADELARDLKNAIDTAMELRQQLRLMEEHARGEVWRWQADGANDLATMGNRMGVLIYASDLRNLLAAAPTPAAQADSALEDAARLEFEMQHGSAIDAARKQGVKHDNH